MALAAARVAVHFLDQRAHGVHAVAGHLRRVAARGRHQLLADHQQAEVMAGDVALDDHVGADVRSDLVGRHHFLAGADAHRHALALVAVTRLDHHRGVDFLRGGPGLLGAAHRAAQRHRHAGGVQQALGQFLVLRDRFGHGAGAVGLGSLDAALLAAPAELHHRALRQAPVGDAARHAGVDDRAGAGPQAHVFVQVAQAMQRVGEVEGGVVVRGQAQSLGQL
ncbi:hypothetical protein D9M69_460420 [compost metagenome]